MVKDRKVKRLWRALSSGKTLAQAADQADMDEKTARKYRKLGRLPSEVAPERIWRTREDPFAEVWPEVHEQLQDAPGLEAKTLFAWLQTKFPGKFDDSQLRSFQRGVKPDPRGPQCLFGSQPINWREGRGAAVRGARRGLVRPEGDGAFSTPAWAEEACDQLSPHYRLAGAETGGF